MPMRAVRDGSDAGTGRRADGAFLGCGWVAPTVWAGPGGRASLTVRGTDLVGCRTCLSLDRSPGRLPRSGPNGLYCARPRRGTVRRAVDLFSALERGTYIGDT